MKSLQGKKRRILTGSPFTKVSHWDVMPIPPVTTREQPSMNCFTLKILKPWDGQNSMEDGSMKCLIMVSMVLIILKILWKTMLLRQKSII